MYVIEEEQETRSRALIGRINAEIYVTARKRDGRAIALKLGNDVFIVLVRYGGHSAPSV